ncbi:MFS transporter [Streptomyces sp. 8K308]|uniref:MFS transporter n=1 Tax=Streptomyces sp. 8K308 TaxID=2530388 RepID=UPI001404DF2B|nr:MFS transporter [Streptomyces sp. 8K308]
MQITPSPRFVWLLTLACGLTVANLYYTQPLLHAISESFGVSQGSTGAVVTATQLGYAAALVLLVPLGDIVPRRPLVCGLLLVDAAALTVSAVAPNLTTLIVAACVVGVSSVVVQILVPFAASVAGDAERNRVIGMLLSGMLIGVLLSRTFAGLVSEAISWRAVYALAALFMLLAASVLFRLLGPRPADLSITYRQQMRAIVSVAASQPVLRRRSLIGACVYAAFNCFWTTAAFLLADDPYHFDQGDIGLFGLVGVAGALTTNLAGRYMTDARQSVLSGLMLSALVLSFLAMGVGGEILLLLIVGVLVMDATVQGVHLLNQGVIYALQPSARARLTAVYMTSYFIGGALGSAIGSTAYQMAGWAGASVAGGGLSLIAFLAWAVRTRSTGRAEPAVPQAPEIATARTS